MAYPTLHTYGNGLWSDEARSVKLTSMRLFADVYIDDDDDDFFSYAYLEVYFSTRSWNVDKHGLIYTDKQFIKEFRSFLKSQGLSSDVWYTEQGMQGDDFVSMGVGNKFIKSWAKHFNIHIPSKKEIINSKNSSCYTKCIHQLNSVIHNSRTMKKIKERVW